MVFEHDNVNHEFRALVQDKIATLKYRVSLSPIWDCYSTYVPPEIRGHHVGQKLVQYALDQAKRNHFRIIPTCPFVKHFIDNHPEYEPLTYKTLI